MKPEPRAAGWPAKGVLLCLICLGMPAAALAGYKPGRGWPEVSTPFFHAATPALAGSRITHWKAQPGILVGGYLNTGSMRPVLHDTGEMLVMDHCRTGTPLVPGMLVVFDRGDHAAVLHYIAAMSRDGRQLYLSGVNNRQSDGWFPRTSVRFVIREIITAPRLLSSLIAVQAPPGNNQVTAAAGLREPKPNASRSQLQALRKPTSHVPEIR